MQVLWESTALNTRVSLMLYLARPGSCWRLALRTAYLRRSEIINHDGRGINDKVTELSIGPVWGGRHSACLQLRDG